MSLFLRFFLNLPFKSKLLLSYSVVVLIPILTWVVYSFHQTNGFILEQSRQNFRNLFTAAYGNMDQKLMKIENAFELITQDTTMIQIINGHYDSNYEKYSDIINKFDPMINSLQMMNPEIKKINIFTNGDIKNSRTNFMALSGSNEQFPYLDVVKTIDPIWIFDGGKLIVAKQLLSIDTPDSSAIISLEVDPNYVFRNNVAPDLQNYGMWISDDKGDIIYREDHLTRQAPPPAGLPPEQLTAAVRSESALYLVQHTAYPRGWVFSMYMDTAANRISFNSAFRSTIGMILLSAVLILIVILLFSRTFERRIAKLSRLLSGVVAGGFESNIHSSIKDEIGEITNSIGTMVRQTRQLIGELNESHTQQREAEIKALQSQINPHFLYNTLSAINWQAIKSGNEEISRIAVALSSFYRATLNKGNMVTTVRAELENIKAYIDIQASIRDNAFHVEYDIEEDILDYNMPNIILQPIVENAIEHGLDPLDRSGRGLIRIRAREDGHDIVLEVADNGNGIAEATIRDVLVDSKKGYGVKNVDDRLKLFFDENYGLSFRAAAPRGTIVEVRIPKYVHF